MYVSVMSNIFSLIENILDIIKDKYYLNIDAKYYNSITNDAYTRFLADNVSCPAKVIWLTAFFLNSKCFFVWLLFQPLTGQLGHQLMKRV